MSSHPASNLSSRLRLWPLPLALACLWAGSACVHSLRDQLQQELSLWQGKSPDQLVEQWGAPQSSYLLETGRKVLTYQDIAIISRTIPYGAFLRPEVYSFSDTCRLNFFTDAAQKHIESVTTSGSPSVCLDMIESLRHTPQPSPTPPH